MAQWGRVWHCSKVQWGTAQYSGVDHAQWGGPCTAGRSQQGRWGLDTFVTEWPERGWSLSQSILAAWSRLGPIMGCGRHAICAHVPKTLGQGQIPSFPSFSRFSSERPTWTCKWSWSTVLVQCASINPGELVMQMCVECQGLAQCSPIVMPQAPLITRRTLSSFSDNHVILSHSAHQSSQNGNGGWNGATSPHLALGVTIIPKALHCIVIWVCCLRGAHRGLHIACSLHILANIGWRVRHAGNDKIVVPGGTACHAK